MHFICLLLKMLYIYSKVVDYLLEVQYFLIVNIKTIEYLKDV